MSSSGNNYHWFLGRVASESGRQQGTCCLLRINQFNQIYWKASRKYGELINTYLGSKENFMMKQLLRKSLVYANPIEIFASVNLMSAFNTQKRNNCAKCIKGTYQKTSFHSPKIRQTFFSRLQPPLIFMKIQQRIINGKSPIHNPLTRHRVADFNLHLAEISADQDKINFYETSLKEYNITAGDAVQNMPATHPLRLSTDTLSISSH
jgi:hypothetical protein